ncbi:MAG: hypothetical protein HFI34_00260 [Lachnospiraceae bacterium]|nr:hypothetical protein [Lachnospiraceae bacterium]
MSQKKVDEYKKEKANRKKIIAKQKRNAILMKLAGVIITALFFGFIIFSVYDKWIKEDEEATIATYALSAEEITSAFEAYTAESEENNSTSDSQEETTSKNSEETTSSK